jgi:hypothetical protein
MPGLTLLIMIIVLAAAIIVLLAPLAVKPSRLERKETTTANIRLLPGKSPISRKACRTRSALTSRQPPLHAGDTAGGERKNTRRASAFF